MKTILLLSAFLALPNLAGAAETLTISPANGLPDHTKLTAAIGTSDRFFVVGFAVGDFNKDGRRDLVVQTGGSFDYPYHPLGAQTFLQETNGTFTKGAERLLPTTGFTWDFVPEDFDEDGNLDILMEDSDHDMLLMRGNGDGTFQPAQFLGLSASGLFAVADLDGDLHLDIVAGKLDGKVGSFRGDGHGAFSLTATLDTRVRGRGGEIMIGDVNADGELDIVVASVPINTFQPGNLDVFLGNGDGTFQAVMRTTGAAVRRGVLVDFNGDGKLDYAGDRGSPEQLEIWLGAGNGQFARRVSYSLNGAHSSSYGIKTGDVNHDGIQDVVVAGDGAIIPATPMSIFLGVGDGTFRPRIPFTQANGNVPINTGGQLIDFNGDGYLDILTLSWLGTDPATELEAMSIALSKGPRRDSRLGALLNVERSAGSSIAPVILEASTNLITWTALTTNLSSLTNWPVTDTATNLSLRYYRTRRPNF